MCVKNVEIYPFSKNLRLFKIKTNTYKTVMHQDDSFDSLKSNIYVLILYVSMRLAVTSEYNQNFSLNRPNLYHYRADFESCLVGTTCRYSIHFHHDDVCEYPIRRTPVSNSRSCGIWTIN